MYIIFFFFKLNICLALEGQYIEKVLGMYINEIWMVLLSNPHSGQCHNLLIQTIFEGRPVPECVSLVYKLLEDAVWVVEEGEGGGGVELGLEGGQDGGPHRPDVVHVPQTRPV